MGAPSQTIGYRYYLSLLMGLCRGPIDELRMIKVGDEIAWDGHQCGTCSTIEKPELFGGDAKEGGIEGPFCVFMGKSDQELPGAVGKLPSVKDSIGGRVSDFRGVVTIWYDGLVSAMNPYLKEWKFRVRRTNQGWWNDDPWYPEKAAIHMAGGAVKAMNGAHILYECCTNPEWGRGLPASKIGDSFIYAANTLCSEGFGICLAWYRKEDIEVFIKKVVDLIAGSLYVDRETGLTELRLTRADYVTADLPLFTPTTGLLVIEEDDASSSDTNYNEVIGTGRDPITNQDFQMRAQNLAGFQAQQAVASLDQDYRGIPTKELLGRVVSRDLRANAIGLKRYRVVLDRRGWRIAPGMPFRVSDPSRGIGEVVLRAGEIDDGDMVNGRITIKSIQDVFGLPDTSYITPVDNTWTPPNRTPLPAEGRLVEASYRDLYRTVGETDAQAADADAGFIGSVAVSPSPVSYEYDLMTKLDTDTSPTFTRGPFTGFAKLTADVDHGATEWVLSDLKDFDEANIDQALLIGDEIVRLDTFDPDTNTATVARGCADTIPQTHAEDAVIYTIDDDLVSDQREYATGEEVTGAILTRTSTGILAVEDAPELTLTVVGRQAMPYPPGDVQIDGQPFYAMTDEHAEPVITWTHRDRLIQADTLVEHEAASVGPEAGVTYTLRFYGPGNTLVRTEDGIAGTTFTYDSTMQVADGVAGYVRIELESVRDDIASYQRYDFSVVLDIGWGFDWGAKWGAPS